MKPWTFRLGSRSAVKTASSQVSYCLSSQGPGNQGRHLSLSVQRQCFAVWMWPWRTIWFPRSDLWMFLPSLSSYCVHQELPGDPAHLSKVGVSWWAIEEKQAYCAWIISRWCVEKMHHKVMTTEPMCVRACLSVCACECECMCMCAYESQRTSDVPPCVQPVNGS